MKQASVVTQDVLSGEPKLSAHAVVLRVTTIDILRALTMVLMIFVNDLFTLTNIPAWLGHVDAGVDGLGLSDVVFPAFLFIVGLSIPFAMDNRRMKGDTDWQLIKHVIWRTAALLVMGVFLVNGETINAQATGLARYLWGPVCCLCFILIWNTYPASMHRALVYGLRGIAALTLIALAVVYRGGPEDAIRHFSPQWWGILGLIGWAYLVCGLFAIFARNNFHAILAGWLFFSALSMIRHADLVPGFLAFIPEAIRGGTLVALTMGGVLTSIVFRYYRSRNDNKELTGVLLGAAGVLVLLSVVTRPYWGISKLAATPAWLFLCSAFTILAFLALYWVADVKGKAHWFAIIKPAGVATLLCYLVPHFAYLGLRLSGVTLPAFMLDGGPGLLKSFLFAMLCVGITALLIRMGVKVRL